MSFIIRNKAFILNLTIVLLVSYYFAFLRLNLNWQYPSANLEKLFTFQAKTPFQYRTLIPFIIQLIYKIPFIKGLVSNITELALYSEFIFTVLLLLVTQKYLYLITNQKLYSRFFSFLILYILSFNLIMVPGRNLYYPYDIPSVFFFTTGIYLLYRKNYIFYYFVFILSTFNRETSCFLTVTYLITHIGIHGGKRVLINTSIQLFIWIMIKYILLQVFKNNPAEESESNPLFIMQIKQNLLLLQNAENLFIFLGSFGFAWIPIIFFYKKIQDRFVSKSLLTVIPFLSGMFVVGVITELRIFSELAILIISALAIIVKSLLKDTAG